MKKILFYLVAGLMMSLNSCAQNSAPNAATDSVATDSVDTVAVDPVVVMSLPKGLPVDDILSTIVSEFKDQVVVIDFWATWCPPCMAAMEKIDPIKEKYLAEGKPVAFVYVTGETSPLAKWQATIPTIKGYHYRLTDKEYNGLLRSLGIRGIPTYYIADKKGKRFYDNIATGGYPGDEVIVAQIEDALNK